MQDVGNNAMSINSVEAVKDANDMNFRKGQLNILAYLLNLEPAITNSYEELTENQDD
jgi:hypothetical protein